MPHRSTLHICCLTLFALLTSSAYADSVVSDSLAFTYALTTNDPTGWQAATLFTGKDGYVNPTKEKDIYTSIGTTWEQIANSVIPAWTAAAQGNRSSWVNAADWIAQTAGNENKVDNGFYAYKYTLHTEGADTAVTGNLNLTLGADDYISAVYANGQLIDSWAIRLGTGVTSDQYGIGNGTDTNWLEWSSKSFDVGLINGELDLVFVVHNTNAAGSPTVNPSGLYVNGTLKTNIELKPGETAATPEPATMLIFGLGIAGLGFARRRVKK